MISKHCSASKYVFFHLYGKCAIAMTTAAIPVDQLVPPPPEQLLTLEFTVLFMCTFQIGI